MKMTDDQVITELRSDSKLNRARQVLSSHLGRMEQIRVQATRQKPVTPVQLRRMEFEVIQHIAIALGVKL